MDNVKWSLVDLKVYAVNNSCIPEYATSGSSGFDLRANIDYPLSVKSKDIEIIPTGVYVSIPEFYEIQIRPRSGLAINKGLTVVNSPGTVDSDYRGELKVGLINLSDKVYVVNPYDRIAQAVVCPILRCNIVSVNDLDELGKTIRGSGGFGSSGLK